MDDEIYTPRVLLTAIYEAGYRRDSFFLRTFFPEVHFFEEEKIDLDKIQTKVPMAPFCSPMIGGKVERLRGYSTPTFLPAYVKSKHPVKASNTMRRLPGEKPGEKKDMGERYRNLVMQNLQDEEIAISDREEWMAVHMTLYGEYLVDGENIEEPFVISAGRRPENNISLIGAAAWDQQDRKTYNVVKDIEQWANLADGLVDIIVLDKKGWSLLCEFDSFNAKLETRRGSGSRLETALKDLNKTVSVKGHLGDVSIVVVEQEYIDGDGSKKKHLPDHMMLLGTTSARGLRCYGAIQDLDAIESGEHVTDRYPKKWREGKDPAVDYTMTQSAPGHYMADVNHFVFVKLVPDQ